MKLTFEGKNLREILEAMEWTLNDADYWKAAPSKQAAAAAAVPQGLTSAAAKPVDVLKPQVEKWVEKLENRKVPAVEKPKRARSEKQLANDEKMRVAALERIAAKKAAKVQSERYATNLRNDLDRDPIEAVEKPVEEPQPEPFADPAEAVQLRNSTIEELQEAYANGHQDEVFTLLKVHGNGAKSFRELPVEAFPAIRKAIDLGALDKEAPK